MVSSVDGFIARKDNSISWFEMRDDYDRGIDITKQDIETFLATIDCYIMGARTYEHALELSTLHGWAYGDIPTIVITHRSLPVERPNIQLYSGDLTKLVNEHLKPNYKRVWLAGGALLAREFINLKLADELQVSIMPIILGGGIPFFNLIKQEHALHLQEVTAYKSGMVELCYEIKKEN